jgi:hypothetical protein
MSILSVLPTERREAILDNYTFPLRMVGPAQTCKRS